MRVGLAWMLWALWLAAAPAAGQVLGGARPAQTAPSRPGFLTRYDVHTRAARLAGAAGRQFVWDADLGVDLDVFDLAALRGNVFLNLETMVGSERRAIDPTQANYTMDLSVFARLPRGELGVTLHHISRHRADREQPGSPSWNMLGVSVGDRFDLGVLRVDLAGRWLGTVTSSEVDYAQEIDASFRVVYPTTGRVAFIGELDGVLVRNDPARFGRERLRGGAAHVGIRVRGGAGAGELVIGRERRLDPDIVLQPAADWTRFAFRFVLD